MYSTHYREHKLPHKKANPQPKKHTAGLSLPYVYRSFCAYVCAVVYECILYCTRVDLIVVYYVNVCMYVMRIVLLSRFRATCDLSEAEFHFEFEVKLFGNTLSSSSSYDMITTRRKRTN